MDRNFWLERWERNEIGFHQDQVNPYLKEFIGRLNIKAGSAVFVPLCGKSRDMSWLAEQGYQVIGVEISPLAIDAFFQENGLLARREPRGDLVIASAGPYRLFSGDFFALHPKDLDAVAAVYDRASFIALPPEMRSLYAAQMRRLLPAGCRLLLVTLNYPAGQMQGPPFPVDRLEIERLYGALFDIEELKNSDVLAQNPRFAGHGVAELREEVYLLIPKGQSG